MCACVGQEKGNGKATLKYSTYTEEFDIVDGGLMCAEIDGGILPHVRRASTVATVVSTIATVTSSFPLDG